MLAFKDLEDKMLTVEKKPGKHFGYSTCLFGKQQVWELQRAGGKFDCML